MPGWEVACQERKLPSNRTTGVARALPRGFSGRSLPTSQMSRPPHALRAAPRLHISITSEWSHSRWGVSLRGCDTTAFGGEPTAQNAYARRSVRAS